MQNCQPGVQWEKMKKILVCLSTWSMEEAIFMCSKSRKWEKGASVVSVPQREKRSGSPVEDAPLDKQKSGEQRVSRVCALHSEPISLSWRSLEMKFWVTQLSRHGLSNLIPRFCSLHSPTGHSGLLKHKAGPGWAVWEVAAMASELQEASASFSWKFPGAGSEVKNSHQKKKELWGWKYNVWRKEPQLPLALSACTAHRS